ncbi:small gtp-binding protein [Vairimorpha apis BRL 01]|uniref:Small gtp-binding protein n=1 Tax=Vairimorpha apis BRL 01 TaxID=1037528 RepID=T0L3N6_9MICR|nr:small gtp-binding protein [Vairimorpha apis BRL 01]
MKGSTKKILITLLLINIYDLRRWELNFVNCANIIDYNNDVIDVTELILNETISQEVLEENLNMLTPTSINLSNRNLTFVPSKIKFLKNLIHFNSCNNALIDFCELPTSLKYINLSVNKIENLPEHFFNLINLEVIIVRHNYLSEFPKLIENFINLKIIDFSFNNIFIIHSTIGELFNVEKIILMDNKIKSLPDSIGKLTKLNYIDLSLNNLSKFPDNCSNLCMLYQLNLSDNSFTNIETICNIKSIKILFLSRNYISLIPNNINNLENLQCLDLSGNAILNIKPICNLKVLETLYLCDNNISEISSNICNLKNLSFLSLSDNNISYLPKELIKCKNLRVLFLKNNEIKTIHNDLFEMLSNLDFLDLRGNSIKYPADSTDIDIHELKVKMGDKLLIDDYKINIYNIYAILNAKPIKFKFLNLRKCRPYTLPLHIYSEQELFDKINDWEKNLIKMNTKLTISL